MCQLLSFRRAIELLIERGAKGRSITAIAGPPAAGKSTVTSRLAEELNRIEPHSAAVLQMDGFHYDDRVLLSRNLLHRKGAPQTFDTGGLACALQRLKRNSEAEVAVPVFDRSLEVARGAGAVITRSTRHILVEGNYLLLNCSPCNGMARMFDTTIFISANIDAIKERLFARWDSANLSADVVAAKIEQNDLLNAETVISESVPAEFVLASTPQEAPK